MLTEAQARALAERIKETLPDWHVQVQHTSADDITMLWERIPALHALPLEDLLERRVGWFVSGSRGDPEKTGVTIWDHVPPDDGVGEQQEQSST